VQQRDWSASKSLLTADGIDMPSSVPRALYHYYNSLHVLFDINLSYLMGVIGG
jgi:hypothetical protein